jgi:AAA ATPase domain
MDPLLNPYTPNAGASPPFLVGRDQQLLAFDILLARLIRGRPQQSLMVTGLRGVGKTVLLGAFERSARSNGWVTADTELSTGVNFGPQIASLARRALLEIAPRDRWRKLARRAARVLSSFSLTVSTDGSITASVDAEPFEGLADSGDFGDDLTDVFLAMGEAAREHETGVVFLLDEVQALEPHELEGLIRALHKTVQRELPLTVVAAGLPNVPRLVGEAKSYAERLFRFQRIGALAPQEAADALTKPAEELGVEFAPQAVDAVITYTEGYPYFVQEYGAVIWDSVADSPVGAVETIEAQALVEVRLDESFFRVRVERASPAELRYLRAMASLGPQPQRAIEVAKALGRDSGQVAQIRSRLIQKGLLFQPGHGLAAFTVPQFDRFLRRSFPALQADQDV